MDSKYQHIIFDFDYTLFDTSEGMALCYKEALTAIGVQYDDNQLDIYVKESLKMTYNRFKTTESFERFENVFLKTSEKYMCKLSKIYPETYQIVGQLYKKGKKISIVTGKPRVRVVEILKKYNMDCFFTKIVGYGDYSESKPNPESLNICITEVGVKKENCVYVGDSLYDVEAASNAGIKGVLIDRSKKTKNAIEGLSQIMELL